MNHLHHRYHTHRLLRHRYKLQHSLLLQHMDLNCRQLHLHLHLRTRKHRMGMHHLHRPLHRYHRQCLGCHRFHRGRSHMLLLNLVGMHRLSPRHHRCHHLNQHSRTSHPHRYRLGRTCCLQDLSYMTARKCC